MDAAQKATLAELKKLRINVLVGMLQSFDALGASQEPKDRYEDVYIHSKLLLVDDVFCTLGSANINTRSMSTDSEINLATLDTAGQGFVREHRQRIWQNLAGSDLNGGMDLNATSAVHGKWKDRMDNNQKQNKKDLFMFDKNSHIVPFEDKRTPFMGISAQ